MMTRSSTVLAAAFSASAAALSIIVMSVAPASAQDITAETVSTRIDIAGRQRMLSQRMAKFFCYAQSGVDAEQNAQKMAEARDLYAASHMGILEGNAAMGLFPEGKKSVTIAWEQVALVWNPLNRIYGTALAGDAISEESFGNVMSLTSEVMKRDNELVALSRSAYADVIGDGGLGAAILIDLYGRQRMLSQKLSKEVCLMARDFDVETTGPELSGTLELFETSLNAFINGLPVAGIPVPPTDEIAAQLALADAKWQSIRDIAVAVSGGRGASPDELAKFSEGADTFLVEMNKAVGMLAAHQASEAS